MKSETLEALMIDSALGELTPEAEELLQDHLNRDPASARRAEECRALVRNARRTVALTLERPARPLARDRLAPPLRRRDGPHAFRPEIMRLAACLLIGLAVGWWAKAVRKSGAPDAAATTPAVRREASRARPADAANLTPDFWSVAYLRERQSERPVARNKRPDAYRIPWESLGN